MKSRRFCRRREKKKLKIIELGIEEGACWTRHATAATFWPWWVSGFVYRRFWDSAGHNLEVALSQGHAAEIVSRRCFWAPSCVVWKPNVASIIHSGNRGMMSVEDHFRLDTGIFCMERGRCYGEEWGYWISWNWREYFEAELFSTTYKNVHVNSSLCN